MCASPIPFCPRGLHPGGSGDVSSTRPPRMTGDDCELLARLRAGPPPEARAALTALYERHGGAVLRFLRRLLVDPNDADDVLQDTFLTANKRADTFRGEDARPWLLAIAGNRARDVRRRSRGRVRRERDVARPEAAAKQAPGHDVERHLSTLTNRDQVVLELRFAQGLTHAETAAVLGISVRTAKTWSGRALETLRQRMEAES